MSSKIPPASQQVPETDSTYERAQAETVLDKKDATPTKSDEANANPMPTGGPIRGDMHTEEPEGWDLAPTDIKDPRQKRHPRPDGVGGSDPNSAKRDPKR
jgi:hypothetical protein